jgi:hypothetical protein
MAKEVNIVVRGVPRAEPDLKRLARALLRRELDVQAESSEEATKPEGGTS